MSAFFLLTFSYSIWHFIVKCEYVSFFRKSPVWTTSKSIHVLCLHPMWWSTADHLTLTSLTLISTFMMSLRPLILSEVLPLPPPVPQLHLQHPLSSKSTVSTRHVQTNLPWRLNFNPAAAAPLICSFEIPVSPGENKIKRLSEDLIVLKCDVWMTKCQSVFMPTEELMSSRPAANNRWRQRERRTDLRDTEK